MPGRLSIGVLLGNVGPSQLVSGLSRFAEANPDLDVVAFFESAALPFAELPFACMQMDEAWSFTGMTLATSFATAFHLLTMPGQKRKFFYVWDLEWARWPRKEFAVLRSVYANPRLELLARSYSHANVLSRAWNRPVKAVLEDFNLDLLEA